MNIGFGHFRYADLPEVGSLEQPKRETFPYTIHGEEILLCLTPDVSRPNLYSQLLISAALKERVSILADLGCGSGVVGLFVAKHHRQRPDVYCIDTDLAALEATRTGIRLNALGDRVNVLNSDWLSDARGIHFDLLASSPPHTPCPHDRFVVELAARRGFAVSSFGGTDGLDAIRVILEQAKRLSRASLLFACGGFLTESLTALCESFGRKASTVTETPVRLSALGLELREHIEGMTNYVFPLVEGHYASSVVVSRVSPVLL